MRLSFLIVMALLPFAGLSAQTSADVFPDGTPVPAWFSNSSKVDFSTLGERYVLTDYGVKSGSPLVQTEAIQKVIDLAASRGGGVVVVPEGLFVSGALHFGQGTNLYVEGTLKGSDRVVDFPLEPTRIEGQNCMYFPALVNVENVNGFALGGPGVIDGSGYHFWEEMQIRWNWNKDAANKDGQRPRLIFITGCSNVTVQDLHLKDSPFWTCHSYRSDHLRFLDLTITSPTEGVPGYSTDAIGLDNCHDVLVKGCYMSVNDDGVVLKGGRGTFADLAEENGPNYNIIIEDCRFSKTHGCLTLGSESIHDINVILRRCVSEKTLSVLWLKLRPDTPQHYEHILVEDVSGQSEVILKVLPWTQYYDKKPRADMPVTKCHDITLRNISVSSPKPLNVSLSGQYVLERFTWDGKDILADLEKPVYTRPAVDMTGYPMADDHFGRLYAAADGKYVWRNWKGSLEKWRKGLHKELTKTLGLDRMELEMKDFHPTAKQFDCEDLGTYTRERWEIMTEPDVALPVVILRPKNITTPIGLMVTPHGHSLNTEMYAGIYWSEEDRSLAEDGERNIALQAVQEGFLAIAPTARGFGKTRVGADLKSDALSSCHDYMLHDLLIGRTPIGERVWDIMRIIDWALENLPVDSRKIVVSGHSGGGTAAFYAGAVDSRIALCLPSGSFCSFEKSILAVPHCYCNYLPGILNLGNMGDIAGLMAGRHLCIIQGKDDEIFPLDGAKEEFEKTKEIFQAAGKGSCSLAVGDGGHRYYKDPAWAFIKKNISVF